jgi:hypothetical protein
MTKVKRGSLRKILKSFQAFKPSCDLDIQFAKKYFESLDTPLSLGLYLCLRHGDHLSLATYRYDPNREIRASSVRDNLAAISLLRKYKGLTTSINTSEVAKSSFFSGEKSCAATNVRFRHPGVDPLNKGANVWLHNAFTQKITRILGTYRKDDFFDLGAWGPGSTIGITGNDTSASRKFRCEKQIATKLYTLIHEELPHQYPHWFPSKESVENLQCVTWSELLTVHKNALTDRTIFKESGITTWFQKSLGKSIRARLMRHGYDLNSTVRSQAIAREGSINGLSCTVDFANASNTIARLMVQECIKDQVWLTLLESCRTPSYSLDKGKTKTQFEMFSSMGNGYTFELESLIFVAAAEACHDYLGLAYDNISVHGDDITINTEAFSLYRDFCTYLGFTVNEQKSFSSGHFRESCGAYYYHGFDVKPYFLKEKSHDAKSIFRLANGLSSVAHRHRLGDGRDLRFYPLYTHLVSQLPTELRLYGTVIQGDIALHVDFDECAPVVAGDGHEGYFVPSILDVPVSLESTSLSVLLTRLWYPSEDMAYGNRSNLRAVTRTSVKTVFVQRWYNFGPWR